MLLTGIFAVSGTGIALLLISKRMEEKTDKPLFILGAISRGDARVRAWTQGATRFYSETRERSKFFITKQLPLRMRNLWNKSLLYLKTEIEKHVGNIRGSRLLKRNGGISEYFKSIREVGKGNGEIPEVELDINSEEPKQE